MLEVFTYKIDAGHMWYVTIEDHVLDQGFNKTVKGALSRANASKEFLAGQLNLPLEEDAT